MESSLLSLIRANGIEKRTRFLSFSDSSIRKIKQLDASIPTVYLISDPQKDPVQATIDIPADELGIRYRDVTLAMVEEAHKCGLLISVWTVDDGEDMRRMIELGVDRITTNYPDRLIRILGKE